MKKNKLEFTQDIIPVKDIKAGIIETTDGRYIKILEIEPINFMLRSDDEQFSIISSFASWLKICPVRMQFKSITRRADTEKHLEVLRKELRTESDNKCWTLGESYINLIKEVGSKEALTRRFFLIFQYESPHKNDDFQQVYSTLQTVEQNARAYFSQCGNNILQYKNPNEEIMEILYTYFNRNSCTTEPFVKRVERVVMDDKGLANDVTIVANEDVNYTLTMGDAAIDYEMGTTITNPGTYSLVVTDEIGNRTEMSFTVVKSLVSKFEHNFDDMQGFEKVLVNGEDKRLNYGTLELFADGEYEVGVVANGVTYTFNITVDGTKPTIKLNGVENGGKTENPVTITDLSEKGEVTVYLNNEKLLYELGNELTEDGKYRVVAKDECGNTTEYTFEIKANDSFKYIALATVAGIGVIGAVVFFILKKKKKF